MTRVIALFGTRPEVIKLAPVVRELAARPGAPRVINVASGQHTDLLYPFAELFGIRIDHDLRVMEPEQTPSDVCARVLAGFDAILVRERPALLLVQGDTTTAMAGALAAFHRGIPVAHVEAGLRSGDPASPFPEEMNRRLITRLATWHFAATARNRERLLAEGVPAQSVFVTGNPVVDALEAILAASRAGPELRALVEKTRGFKRLVLTTHRRESFGGRLAGNLARCALSSTANLTSSCCSRYIPTRSCWRRPKRCCPATSASTCSRPWRTRTSSACSRPPG